jgi:ubiquinone/menaquinone biosynthesis C-methylase UbiE
MSDQLTEIFWEIHNGLPRAGPGDNDSTRRAYLMLKDLPENPRIIDIGCGPGMQTIELAKLSKGQIDALDNHQPFLDQLDFKIKKESFSDNIKPVKGDMFNLVYDRNTFDLIWSEGAIFVIGFEKGLREWKRLLTDDGYLVVSDLSWLKNNVPLEVKEFLDQYDPTIKTIQGNLDIIKKLGYRLVGFFVLPSESWWTYYYNPILAKLPSLKEKYKNDEEKLRDIAPHEVQIDMFRKYSEFYGYVFYVVQCST